jgi:glyoxylase-like metal-dependent hydrolase (beta-lactamase superfamily II)
MQAWLQKPAVVSRVVKDGDLLPIAGGIRVIATPGHTQDNMSYFWERERVLFCPDLLNNLNGLSPTRPAITWDMEAAKGSIRKVLALNPEVICVGHGEAFRIKDAPGEINALLSRL